MAVTLVDDKVQVKKKALQSLDGEGAAPPEIVDETPQDYSKAQKKLFLEQIADKEKARLSESEKKLLKDTYCCPNTSGNGTVLLNESGHAFAEFREDKIILKDTGPLDSNETIDSYLKSALAVKSTMPEGGRAFFDDPVKAALMIKCAEMTGAKIVSDTPVKSLKELDPALDAKVEARWKAMGGTVPELANTASAHVPGSVVTADAATFKKEVLDSNKPVILEISDPGCDVCHKESPEVASIAAKAGDKAKVVKIDLTELYDVMHSLPENDPLRKQLDQAMNGDKPFGVPALAVFDQGKMKEMQVGFQTADQIQNWANDAAGQTLVANAAANSPVLQQQLKR